MSIETLEQHTTKHKTKDNTSSNKPRQASEQWNAGKSIGGRNKNTQTPRDTHVTRKSKPLTKQTPVVAASTDTSEGSDEGAEGENSYSEIYESPSDYRIYQEGQVSDFFKDTQSGAETAPKTVSEVCLVNDHYILVKMPSNTTETSKTEITNAQQSPDDVRTTNRKLCHYLRKNPNRIRKIAPINEEPEYLEVADAEAPAKSHSSKSLHCLNVNSCWRANVEEVEVYQTQTTILKSSPPQSMIMVGRGEWKSPKPPPSQTPAKADNTIRDEPKQVQSISGSILTSSLHDRVALRNCGALVANDNNNLDLDLDHCRKSCATSSRRRKFLQSERFHWLLRPFRGKYRKPKPKIQAVVYKSYFVKWTKPPETLHHGFGGVKSQKLTDLGASVLRRCRSAIF